MSIKEHYDNHLGNFYSWMTGCFRESTQHQHGLFKKINIEPNLTGVAIDLGAGNGIQSYTLANLGFDVLAIDFNEQLLNELQVNCKELPVEVKNDLIQNVGNYEIVDPELISCCGDTIAHFDTMDELENLIMNCYHILPDEGKLILSFRDYSMELQDTERFIPIKSDDNRILTCFLEYFEEHVRVTDILHEKNGTSWVQKSSSYLKLRLTTNLVTEILLKHNFKPGVKEYVGGMEYILALK
ncbi:MAG: hypothetical protein MI922_12980 [Bacteroidales bacterium]|nr:hypothetical protein [Bacteroidales bacterium]